MEVRALAAHEIVYVNIRYKIERMGGEYDFGKEDTLYHRAIYIRLTLTGFRCKRNFLLFRFR